MTLAPIKFPGLGALDPLAGLREQQAQVAAARATMAATPPPPVEPPPAPAAPPTTAYARLTGGLFPSSLDTAVPSPAAGTPAPLSMPATAPAARATPAAISSGPATSTATAPANPWLESLRPTALKYSQQYGIPAEVFLAINASETNWGNAESLFGIKGTGSAGSRNYATHEVVNGQRVNQNDDFAAYNSVEDAYAAFIKLVSTTPRYAAAWQQLQAGDWRGFLDGINRAGYATDPNWSRMIVGIASNISNGNIPPPPANRAAITGSTASAAAYGPEGTMTGQAAGAYASKVLTDPVQRARILSSYEAPKKNSGILKKMLGLIASPLGGPATKPQSGTYYGVGAGAGLARVQNQDIPLYSDFAREEIVPLAGDLGAILMQAQPTAPLWDTLAESGFLDRIGAPTSEEIGRFLGEAAVPITVGDVLTELGPGGVAVDAAKLSSRATRPALTEASARLAASRIADDVLGESRLLANPRANARIARDVGYDPTQIARDVIRSGPEAGLTGPARLSAAAPVTTGTRALPDLGDSGIKAALAAKEEATLKPGAFFGSEGSVQRRVVGALNPSVDLPRDIHVANQSRSAVLATMRSEFGTTEIRAYKRLEAAFKAEQPRYIGPAGRPLAGTWVDYAENPALYDASPALRAAKEELRRVQDEVIAAARSEYGVDVRPFQGADPESVYIPHIQARDDLEKAVTQTSQSISSRSSVIKERAYDSLSDRLKRQPDFKPELDAGTLADVHSSSIATLASNNTFKAGVKGLNKVDVINELHPGLREALVDARDAVSSLRSRIATAMRQSNQQAGRGTLADSRLRAIDRRMEPLEARVENLGEEYGPELSHLSGQIRELRMQAAQLEEGVATATARELRADARLQDLQREINAAQAQVETLAKQYRTAGTGDYILNPKTFRYHTATENDAINSVLKTGFDNAFIDGLIDTGNLARASALGPDFSPLTIQGGLGFFSHPEIAFTDAGGLIKAAFQSPEALRKAINPDVLRRFEFATNRRLGSFSESGEVIGERGLAIPGQPVKKFNDALQRVVDYGTIKAFEHDATLLMKLGAASQNVADHEAANFISKAIPRLIDADTGRSVQRVKLEGLLPTSRSFTAAPALVTKDFISGAAKLTTGQTLLGREKLALARGTLAMGTIMTIAVASALASAELNGKSPTEAVKEVLDPGSPRFASVILGDEGSVSLGGPFRRAFLGLYRTAEPLAPGGTPATEAPVGALRYGRNTLQPDLGSGVDIALNRDWQGRPIREGSTFDQIIQSTQHFLENANLLGSGAIEGYREGGATGAATELASGLAGANYFERSSAELRRRAINEQAMPALQEAGILPDGVELDDLGSGEYDAAERWLRDNRPDLLRQWQRDRRANGSVFQAKADRRSEIDAEFKPEFDALYEDLLSGKRTAEEVLDGLGSVRDTFRGRTDELYADQKYQDAVKKLDANDMRKLEDEWFSIPKEVAGSRKTLTAADWEAVDQKQQSFMQALSERDPALAERFRRNLELRDSVVDAHPLIKLKREVDALSEPYYELPEKGTERTEWLKANPDANVARWLVYGQSLKSAAAVNKALEQKVDLPGALGSALQDERLSREIKLEGLARPINENAKTIEAWQYSQRAITWYQTQLVPQNREAEARRLYKKSWEALDDGQKSAVTGNLTEAARKSSPELDAWLVWWGASETFQTIQGITILGQITQHFGKTPPKADFTPTISKNAR